MNFEGAQTFSLVNLENAIKVDLIEINFGSQL